MSSLLRVFSGNYIATANFLGLPPSFYQDTTPEEYHRMIGLDLDRTPYFVSQDKIKRHQMKLNAGTADHLSYSQGDFDGRLFAQTPFLSGAPEGFELHRFGFSYEDDKGVLCGFAMVYGVEKSKPKEPMITLSIIRDVTASPKDRQVLFASSPGFLKKTQGSQGMTPTELLNRVKTTLQSEALFRTVKKVLTCDASGLGFAKVLCESQQSQADWDELSLSHEMVRQMILGEEHAAQLGEILSMVHDLKKRGYKKASGEAHQLYYDLSTLKQRFSEGKLSAPVYISQSKTRLEQAQRSELKHHRGYFSAILDRIFAFLKKITFGLIQRQPTGSIKKINQLFFSYETFEKSYVTEPLEESFKVSLLKPT
ncbi:MAG: hypothetical protein ACOYKA_00885 [Legionellaceae bacterium]